MVYKEFPATSSIKVDFYIKLLQKKIMTFFLSLLDWLHESKQRSYNDLVDPTSTSSLQQIKARSGEKESDMSKTNYFNGDDN